MKKKFRIYVICWAIILAVFSIVYFAIPKANGLNPIGLFVVAVLGFIGQLISAFFAFQADSLQKFFYKISLISISYTGLILLLIFSIIAAVVPGIPLWVMIIICALIIGFTAVAVIMSSVAVDEVSRIDEKIKNQTLFIKSLRTDAECLMTQAETPETKRICQKVYDALRYSDPMSHEALTGLETEITLKFAELKDAVKKGDSEQSEKAGKVVLILLDERNKKCRLLK